MLQSGGCAPGVGGPSGSAAMPPPMPHSAPPMMRGPGVGGNTGPRCGHTPTSSGVPSPGPIVHNAAQSGPGGRREVQAVVSASEGIRAASSMSRVPGDTAQQSHEYAGSPAVASTMRVGLEGIARAGLQGINESRRPAEGDYDSLGNAEGDLPSGFSKSLDQLDAFRAPQKRRLDVLEPPSELPEAPRVSARAIHEAAEPSSPAGVGDAEAVTASSTSAEVEPAAKKLCAEVEAAAATEEPLPRRAGLHHVAAAAPFGLELDEDAAELLGDS